MERLFPRIMLVDMNSFFASVEQQANPVLRGKPLGVAVSPHPGSCLIGTSKEAKAMGIKNGISVYKARKICPKIMVVESEPEKYREVNRQINRIFSDYTEIVEAYSVDESFLDLRNSKLNPMIVGGQIKQRIRSEVGEWLTCSVGIAPNKFMAKLAADMEKPDGLSIVWQSQLKEIYKSKKLSDLWGISRGWTKRLAKLNITSPSQLLDYPVQNLIAVFGKPGFYLWERVQGLEEDQILLSAFPSPSGRGWPEGSGEGELTYELDSPSLSPTATSPPKGERQGEKNHLPKSFGHSWVLNFRTTDKEKLKIVILRLAEKAARRMRRQQFVAQSVYLSVSLADGNYFGRSKRLNFLVETGLELYYEALKIWANWSFKSEVAHIAVGFASLQVKTRQLSLLPDKYSNLIPTIDLLNNKYGEFTIRSSLLAKTSDFAPDSIAFGK